MSETTDVGLLVEAINETTKHLNQLILQAAEARLDVRYDVSHGHLTDRRPEHIEDGHLCYPIVEINCYRITKL